MFEFPVFSLLKSMTSDARTVHAPQNTCLREKNVHDQEPFAWFLHIPFVPGTWCGGTIALVLRYVPI